MANFRVETVTDPVTNLVALEIYYPHDSQTLLVGSAPTYRTHEDAMADVMALFKRAWPNKDIRTSGDPVSN